MLWINVSLHFLACVLIYKRIRSMHSNLISHAKKRMSLFVISLCPYGKTIRTYVKMHKEHIVRRKCKGCIVYPYAKMLGQVTSLKHMSLCIVSLLMVEAYVPMVFLHREATSPL